MGNHHSAGQNAELQRAAHSLKSACRNVGLSYLGDLAQDLETSAAGAEIERTAFLVRKIHDVSDTAADVLRQNWADMIAAEYNCFNPALVRR